VPENVEPEMGDRRMEAEDQRLEAVGWELETGDCGRVALALPTESAAWRCAITARDKQLSGDSSH